MLITTTTEQPEVYEIKRRNHLPLPLHLLSFPEVINTINLDLPELYYLHKHMVMYLHRIFFLT